MSDLWTSDDILKDHQNPSAGTHAAFEYTWWGVKRDCPAQEHAKNYAKAA